MPMPEIAFVVLNPQGLGLARRVQAALGEGRIHALSTRVEGGDEGFTDTRATVQRLYADGHPVVGLCAAGILIRLVAPLLSDKRAEPPLLALADDGAVVVPLLGGLTGGHELAERVSAACGAASAITASGARRFGLALEAPPDGYVLVNPDDAKRVTSAILAGARVRLEGEAPWLGDSGLPFADEGEIVIRVVDHAEAPPAGGLLYVRAARTGRLDVIGTGPGAAGWLTPEVRQVLDGATDLVGYLTYLDMVPARPGQRRHASDNREELARARQALDLAAEGRRVAVVSSGDPGIFAMAAAVMEALDLEPARWPGVTVEVRPGLSAMQAAAARLGAPLGHDFAVVSLSDNLKPAGIVTRRLEAAIDADFVLALYNPAGKIRRDGLARALDTLRARRAPDTVVIQARDVGRPAERITVTTLGALDADSVDMRTLLLIGSSQTRAFTADGRRFVYTPRSYPG